MTVPLVSISLIPKLRLGMSARWIPGSLLVLALVTSGVTSSYALELGTLQGVVKGPSGQPAAGVSVALRSVGSMLPLERKTLSDLKGQFQFLSLFPGVYALQVVGVEPWNVVSKELLITSGNNDPLIIHLSDIFAVTFKPPRITTERDDPTNDAKWVLRTSRATRPVLRFNEANPVTAVSENSLLDPRLPFRGVLEISSTNDPGSTGLDTNPFNSAFAFIHSFSSSTQLLVAVGVGFSVSNQTSLRSALNMKWDDSHQATISLGLRQFGLPLLNTTEISQTLNALAEGHATVSQIQNFLVSVDLEDKYTVNDQLEVMAGVTVDHIESIKTKNLVRPRVGFSMNLTPVWTFRGVAMNTTTERAKTFTLPEGATIALPSVARMSLSPDAVHAEAVNHFELALERALSSQTHLIFDTYYDQFSNRAMLLSNLNTINVGRSSPAGYSLILLTHPRKSVSAAFGYSLVGGLEETGADDLVQDFKRAGEELLRTRYYHVATVSLSFEVPRAQTQVTALYRQVSGSPLTLLDPFQQSFYASQPGFNLKISKSLPNFTVLPGRMEAHADFRNLFASGAPRHSTGLPIAFLSQQPRVIRGGLSFKF